MIVYLWETENSPQRYSHPIPWTYKYVFLNGKRVFAGVIKCRHLEMGKITQNYTRGLNRTTGIPENQRNFPGFSQRKRCDDGKNSDATLLALKMEEIVSMSQRRQMGARNCKKQGSWLIPRAYCKHFGFNCDNWFWILDIQCCKIINSVLFKPPSLWYCYGSNKKMYYIPHVTTIL